MEGAGELKVAKILGIALIVITVLMIWQGQDQQAANIWESLWDTFVGLAEGFGNFVGELFDGD